MDERPIRLSRNGRPSGLWIDAIDTLQDFPREQNVIRLSPDSASKHGSQTPSKPDQPSND